MAWVANNATPLQEKSTVEVWFSDSKFSDNPLFSDLFWKTDFLCSKNSRFSDILENSRTLI